MVSADTIQMIVGIIGNITSFGIFLSPLPTFIQIFRWKSTKQFSGLPYVITLLDCLLWIFYGLPFVHPHSILVTTINSVGAFLEIIYITMFLYYASEKRGRMIVAALLTFSLLFFGVEAVLTIVESHTVEKRSLIIGLSADVICVLMYASPLSVMALVIRSKSVKFMPFLLSLANFANGLVWTGYALIHFDIFLLIPNSIGALFGASQLVLYATYYKSSHQDKEQELPTVAATKSSCGSWPRQDKFLRSVNQE